MTLSPTWPTPVVGFSPASARWYRGSARTRASLRARRRRVSRDDRSGRSSCVLILVFNYSCLVLRVIRIQGLRKSLRQPARLQGWISTSRRARSDHHRPERWRQVGAAQAPARAPAAGRGRRARGRRRHHQAPRRRPRGGPPALRRRLPGRGALRLDVGLRQRRLPPAREDEPGRRRHRPAGGGEAPPGRARGHGAQEPGRDLGRHAQAGGYRAGP